MSVLMQHDFGIQITVAIRRREIEDKHLRARRKTVGRRGKVGVVEPRSILRLGEHWVVSGAAAAVVAHLKVARRFIESVQIVHVM